MDVDVIVIGSGGAGMSAALTAAVAGAEVLVVERTDRVGGTTTYSGGALWIPNNRLMHEAGIADSRAEQFELVLDGPTAARGVIIRATDALNNITSARGEAPAASAPR